jgi:hypothetical protein
VSLDRPASGVGIAYKSPPRKQEHTSASLHKALIRLCLLVIGPEIAWVSSEACWVHLEPDTK